MMELLMGVWYLTKTNQGTSINIVVYKMVLL